jgi:hypothetical protein
MYEYDVVLASDFDEFVADVNERLANGWQCQGGLAAIYDSKYNIEWWYQAIVKTMPDTEHFLPVEDEEQDL